MIEIKNLTAGYDEKNILQLENLSFEEGKITGIVGLNGSGKSTLLKSILGITYYEGSIKIDGKDYGSGGHKSRARKVAYLPQYHPAANLDVFTLVSHGRFPYLGFSKILGKKDLELVEKALRLTDLWEKRFLNLQNISGGERQRAYLAMVIAQDTKMLMLDEPSTYMDIKHQTELMEILKKLAEEGRGVILTSHDLPQSFTACHKIYVLEKGCIKAQGKPSEIAEKTQILRDVFGVGLKKNTGSENLYDFSLIK